MCWISTYLKSGKAVVVKASGIVECGIFFSNVVFSKNYCIWKSGRHYSIHTTIATLALSCKYLAIFFSFD
ncbi:hypothetical protein P8452_43145 [Trifolium repens]|nr:hypothetical protein P8452_43145 [Trifolium repens]